MGTSARTLDPSALRSELQRALFAAPPELRDAFALELEGFAFGGATPRRARLAELRELAESIAPDCAATVADPLDVDFGRSSPPGAPRISFGAGGQWRLRSGAFQRPREAWESCERLHASFSAACADRGLKLVSLGVDPWSHERDVDLQDPSTTARCLAAANESTAAREHRRMSAATRVFIGLGGDVARAPRLAAARALAPVVAELFANSPLAQGASTGSLSLRVERRRAAAHEDAVREPDVLDENGLLECALDSRVAIVRARETWHPQPQLLRFRDWLAHGRAGVFPDASDWRAHLEALDLPVRPRGWIEIDAQDAQMPPFAAVPLVLWSALLDDARALAEAPKIATAPPDERARRVFVLAADALARRPTNWCGTPSLAAFVDFGRRFALRGATPADELLRLFAARGRFGLAEYDELARCGSAVRTA